jgi:hypothetical protein
MTWSWFIAGALLLTGLLVFLRRPTAKVNKCHTCGTVLPNALTARCPACGENV